MGGGGFFLAFGMAVWTALRWVHDPNVLIVATPVHLHYKASPCVVVKDRGLKDMFFSAQTKLAREQYASLYVSHIYNTYRPLQTQLRHEHFRSIRGNANIKVQTDNLLRVMHPLDFWWCIHMNFCKWDWLTAGILLFTPPFLPTHTHTHKQSAVTIDVGHWQWISFPNHFKFN